MAPSKTRLPTRPVYKMFFDGGQTRRIIEWLGKLDGELGEIDLGNPELQAILSSLSLKISTIETTLAGFPNLTTLATNVSTLNTLTSQHTTNIYNITGDITALSNRIKALEDSTALSQLAIRVTALEKLMDDFKLIVEGLESLDIQPISEEFILEVLAD